MRAVVPGGPVGSSVDENPTHHRSDRLCHVCCYMYKQNVIDQTLVIWEGGLSGDGSLSSPANIVSGHIKRPLDYRDRPRGRALTALQDRFGRSGRRRHCPLLVLFVFFSRFLDRISSRSSLSRLTLTVYVVLESSDGTVVISSVFISSWLD
ncbi:hypothetical protein J6590_061475 [Homalodisca vitripennis]|nr:hypothetical protein J6590_061475 [Homalodisca vitripennis]